MRVVIAVVVWVLGLAGNAMADAPFAPIENVPDHVVTSIIPDRGRDVTRIVRRHGNWSRVDYVRPDGSTTVYFEHARRMSVRPSRGPDGKYRFLTVRREAQRPQTAVWPGNSFRSLDRANIVGESCELWNVAPWHHDPRSVVVAAASLSCVTDDGIELSRSDVGSRGERIIWRAVSVERRPVDPSEVRPLDVFDLAAWIDNPVDFDHARLGTPAQAGAEVVLQPSGRERSDIVGLTVRRRLPWLYKEYRHRDGGRTLWIENIARLRIMVQEAAGGSVLMTVSRLDGVTRNGESVIAPQLPSEPVLGERCSWFDMAPNALHNGEVQCRSSDGLILREHRHSRVSSDTLVAVRIQRREVALSEILPNGEVLRPGFWGLLE